ILSAGVSNDAPTVREQQRSVARDDQLERAFIAAAGELDEAPVALVGAQHALAAAGRAPRRPLRGEVTLRVAAALHAPIQAHFPREPATLDACRMPIAHNKCRARASKQQSNRRQGGQSTTLV